MKAVQSPALMLILCILSVFLLDGILLMLPWAEVLHPGWPSAVVLALLLAVLAVVPFYFLFFRPMTLIYQDLAAGEQQFIAITRDSLEAIVVMDDFGIIRFANPRACAMFGFTDEELYGKPVTVFMPKSLKELHRQTFQAALENQEFKPDGEVRELTGIRKNGTEFDVKLSISSWEKGGRRYFVGMMKDFGQEKIHAMEQLHIYESLREVLNISQRAVQSKSKMLASMSQKIHAPLHAMIRAGELLGQTAFDPEQKRLYEQFKDSSENLLTLLNHILETASLDAGELVLEVTDFRLRDLVEGVAGLFNEKMEKKGIAISLSIGETVPEIVRGDPFRLRQVLAHLVTHAAHTTHPGTIEIRINLAWRDGEERMLLFSVVDTGSVIAQEHQKTIFEGFSQADPSAHGDPGLGLAIVEKLVNAMGGRTCVQSALGQGCAFHFVLDMGLDREKNPAVTMKDVEDRIPRSCLRPLKILIAEATEKSRLILEITLRAENHRVELAMDGEEVLAKMMAVRYDVVFLDMDLPKKSGLAITAEYRLWELNRNYVRIPIFAMTTHTENQEDIQAMAAGCSGHLVKPVQKKPLLALVNLVQTGRL